MILAVLLPKII